MSQDGKSTVQQSDQQTPANQPPQPSQSPFQSMYAQQVGPYGYNPQQYAPPQYNSSTAPPMPPQYNVPPPQFPGQYAPPQYTMQPQPPPSFAMTPAANPATEGDYYKGFYQGVTREQPSSYLGSALYWLVPLAVNTAFFIGPIWYLRRRYMQQAASAAASAGGKGGESKKNPMSNFMEMMMPLKPKQYRVDVKGTKFDDVIGIPEAKEDLKQYVDFLKDSAKFTRLGARLPKGCLLTGNPGTGKTLLARAVAGEANTPFFTTSGADFIEVFGGSGPKRVRELFAEARKEAPCVIFIDEIDAIGSRNGGRTMGGGSSEENRTINQLLAELDGLSSKEPIVVIAATNYPEAIDKALLREGRFDRKVNIPMPDQQARSELFQFYLNRVVTGDAACKPKIVKMKTKKEADMTDEEKKRVQEEDKKAEEALQEKIPVITTVSNKDYSIALADRTPGVSPAQIATIVNEAALAAAVKDEPVVTLPYMQEGIDDVLIGKRHRQRMADDSLRRTAFHECGHAIMAWLSPLQKDVIKVSVIPRGRAGGYTQQLQDEAMEPQTDTFFFSQLCVLLGGRVAERITMGDISTGAIDDLQRATKLSVDKILTYGMSNQKGQLAFRPNDRSDGRGWMGYSEDLHSRAEKEARALVFKAYETTLKTLTDHSSQLDKLGKLLLERKEVSRADVLEILGNRPVGAR